MPMSDGHVRFAKFVQPGIERHRRRWGIGRGIPNRRGSREAWAVPGNSSLVRRVICL